MTDQPTIDPLDAPQEFQTRLSAMLAVKNPVFSDMVKAAGLDPATDFRGADLRGIDFSGSNLVGFDFAGADLRGAVGLSFSSFLSESRIFKLVKDHAEAFTSFDWASDISSAFKPKSMRATFKEFGQGAIDDLEVVLKNVVGARFTDKGQRFIAIPDLADPPYTLSVSPDGAYFVSDLDEGHIEIWDGETGLSRGRTRMFKKESDAMSVCYSPDGAYIAAGSSNGGLCVWNVGKNAMVFPAKLHEEALWGVGFHPDGTRIVSGSADSTIGVWDVSTGHMDLQLVGHGNSVCSVAYHPSGDSILSCSDDGTARLWNVEGKELFRIESGFGPNKAAVFSPNGEQIAIGKHTGTCLSIWDAQTGAKLKDLIANLKGDDKWVNDVCFSPCGRWLVAGYVDNIIRIWDWEAGHEVGQLVGHTEEVTCVAFSPDGTRIFSGSADHSIRIWFLDDMLTSHV